MRSTAIAGIGRLVVGFLGGGPGADGRIRFAPPEGGNGPDALATIADGRYRLKVPAGSDRVEIWANREKPGPVDPTMGARPQEQYLPPRFNAESCLTAEVAAKD